MEVNKILNADVLDIIFEGKNKSYGAYELRKTYNSRLIKALIATAILMALVGTGILVSQVVSSAGEKLKTEEVEMAEVKEKEAPPPPPPPVTPPPPPPPPQIKQIQFTPPIIKKDNEVKKDEKIEEIEEDAAISTETVKTENTNQVVQAPVEVEKSEVVAPAAAAPVEEDKVYTKVEIEAEFPGGAGKWKKYLENNLSGFNPADNGAQAGTYQVIVRFIVAKDGSVSDVVAETNYGSGMEEEAVKVIKRGPKWTPAQQNGSYVKAYRKQPITFVVAEPE
jgi:periplasmic protein TonB